MNLNVTPAELIDQLRAWFHPKDRSITLSDSQWVNSKRVAWEAAVSKSLALPGLVGFWPMSSVQRSTGNAYDMSGQGRTLTYNGNPVYSVYKYFTPYIELDGTGDYLSRADETDLDVLGSETIYASNVRGLTMGGWFWVNTAGAVQALMTKDDAGANRQYLMYVNASDKLVGELFSGAVLTRVTSTDTYSAASWHQFLVRFQPSTRWSTFIDGVETANTTTIPASIDNTAAAFNVGARNGGILLTGRASLCFLCANALPDELILAKYYQERMLFQ